MALAWLGLSYLTHFMHNFMERCLKNSQNKDSIYLRTYLTCYIIVLIKS